jgi:hypothetical protein
MNGSRPRTKPKASPKSEGRAAPNSERRAYDNAGRLDPVRGSRLLAIAAETHVRLPENAFVAGSESDDDLAEELGEGAVVAMTSGEDAVVEDLNHDVEEDWGGPFVESTANKEFASGTDESNIPEATREPFPTV